MGHPVQKNQKKTEELVIKRVFLLSNMFQYYNVHLVCSNKTEDFFLIMVDGVCGGAYYVQ